MVLGGDSLGLLLIFSFVFALWVCSTIWVYAVRCV